ncbi:LysR family transcriptional regulator [Brevibacillus antibioticus]|uniref:LysR family transcriptional regulator n=1 Tax=Brevibacillus antibioticus TaxID=2570228 RepID=A0A4U2YE10_9BACL|nr:LysR family transcriptional regulator [Brevibacillus antibioticus]
MTQPPWTQQIQSLEEELGVKLLERNKRQVRFTVAGTMLVNTIKGFREVFPWWSGLYIEMTSTEQRKALEDGKMDVGFLRVAEPSIHITSPYALDPVGSVKDVLIRG